MQQCRTEVCMRAGLELAVTEYWTGTSRANSRRVRYMFCQLLQTMLPAVRYAIEPLRSACSKVSVVSPKVLADLVYRR